MKALQETGLFTGYDTEHRPLGSYAALMGAFGVSLAGFLGWTRAAGRRLPVRPGLGDLALYGVATHSLTRLVARDRVTSTLRAPFVRFQEDAKAGEVEETSRGQGMQKAMGELLGCPFCLGPWVAAGLVCAGAVRPRETRLVASIFALSAASSFLHRAYEWLGAALHRTQAEARVLSQEAEEEEDAHVQLPGRGPELVEPGRAPIPSPS